MRHSSRTLQHERHKCRTTEFTSFGVGKAQKGFYENKFGIRNLPSMDDVETSDSGDKIFILRVRHAEIFLAIHSEMICRTRLSIGRAICCL